MIVRQKTGLFGGRITAIHTQGFTCTVTTQREGIFKPFVTVIREGDDDRGGSPPHISGRISYYPEFEKKDISQLHETIVQSLEDDGEKGFPIGVAIEGVMEFVKEEGLASETINAAAWGPSTSSGPEQA